VANKVERVDYKYFTGDFNTLPLAKNFYSFVTLNNVLEHTPDIEKTISKMASILAPGGICYIFQNAFPSLIYVLNEPHYKDPALMVLPNDIAVQLLSRKQKQKELRYVVARWPDYAELQSLFEKYELEHEWFDDGFPFRPNPVLSNEDVSIYRKRILDSTLAVFGEHMAKSEKTFVFNTLDRYFEDIGKEMLEAPEVAKRKYLVQNWHIVLRKKI
jgi:SAM-dependent methyltransferase